jgi:hypothetical protein
MTNQSFTDEVQELNALIAAQKWVEASPLAQDLMDKIPLTPGVLERLAQVLRGQEEWEALLDVLMRSRNRYQLWPQGSDLLMGQGMVELGRWSESIPLILAGKTNEAFSALRQAMLQNPDHSALDERLLQLISADASDHGPAEQSGLDASAVLDQELTQIEGLLDQLEAKASTASNIDNEMTFL